MAPKKLITQVKKLLLERGLEALKIARQAVLKETVPFRSLEDALSFFIMSWEDVMHPALLSLACESVGGNPDITTQIGAAMVLLAGGADVHDDVIDQSRIKDSKLTVFGKFGKDVAILVGDALLFKGVYMVHEACAPLPEKKRQLILGLTKQAFFRISSAEARETTLRGKTDSSAAEEYLEMISMKAAVGEAAGRIGAILGDGNQKEVDELGHYGKTLAILYTIRDEFIDAFELEELTNRVEKECLPLPILFALRDGEKTAKIRRFIGEKPITQKEVEIIVELMLDSKETKRLKNKMQLMIENENQRLRSINLQRNMLMLLLQASMEDL